MIGHLNGLSLFSCAARCPRLVQWGLIAWLTGLTPGAVAQTPGDGGSKPGQNSGEVLSVERDRFDLGTFWIGSTPRTTIQLTNRSAQEVEILKVVPGCDCVAVIAFPQRLAPGTGGELVLALDSMMLHGDFSERISIQTRPAGTTPLIMRLTGQCLWYVEPSATSIKFDRLPYGQRAEREVTLTNRSDRPLELTLIEGRKGSAFRASLEAIRRGQEYRLKVTIEPPVAEGMHQDAVDLRTNVESQPLVSIPVETQVVPGLEIIPPVVYLPDGSPRGPVLVQPIMRVIDVVNHDSRKVRLLSARSSIPALRTQLSPIEEGRAYRLLLQGPPRFALPSGGGTIDLATDDPQRQVISVILQPASREGQPPPASPSAAPPVRPALALKGQPAPAFELKTPQGRPVSRSALSGHPATVLNFVSSTCPFCRKQVPSVEALRSRYEPMGVRFVNLGQNKGQQIATLDETVGVLTSLGWQGETAMDPGNQVGRRFRVTSFPTLFVVRPDGQVAEVVIGAKANLAQRVGEVLEQLLAGEGGKPEGGSKKGVARP